MTPAVERIVVVGTSGCGKTAFSRKLARSLGYPRVELDELFWGPSWTPKPESEFRRLAAAAASAPRWVVDGNYGRLREVLWPRATTICWLNYGFFTVLFRVVRRTLSRSITKEELWHGNRESLVRSLFSRKSILVWVITTFHRRRRELQALRAGGKYPHLSWIEFRKPAEAARYLASVAVPPNATASSGKLRIGILASGEGTILQSLLDACASGELDAQVVIVIGNNRNSGAFKRVQAFSVRSVHLSGATHPDPDELDQAILSALSDAGAELIVLAGYMKKVGPKTLAAFDGRIVNTHPALLPKYGGRGMYGRRVHEAVLAAGETQTGVTVHLVDGEYDHGPVIAQTVVPVMANDDVETLSARVQAVERAFLVNTLQSFAGQGIPSIVEPV